MTNLSPAAQAAQDDARNKGRFGEQTHGDPSTDIGLDDEPDETCHICDAVIHSDDGSCENCDWAARQCSNCGEPIGLGADDCPCQDETDDEDEDR